MEDIRFFEFVLKCYEMGFNKKSFIKILQKLDYIHDDIKTSQAHNMIEYFELIEKLDKEQTKENKKKATEFCLTIPK